jgi:hypothetical protein
LFSIVRSTALRANNNNELPNKDKHFDIIFYSLLSSNTIVKRYYCRAIIVLLYDIKSYSIITYCKTRYDTSRYVVKVGGMNKIKGPNRKTVDPNQRTFREPCSSIKIPNFLIYDFSPKP